MIQLRMDGACGRRDKQALLSEETVRPMNMASFRRVSVPRLALLIGILVALSSAYENLAFMHRVRVLAARAATAANELPGASDIADIRSAQWFGNDAAPVAASATYDLKGISLDTTRHAGYALISEDGRPEKSYRLHDRLSTGAEIIGIEPGYVIIQTSAGKQRLSLRPAH